MEYIKIPITQQMKNDYADCQVLVDAGKEKDCGQCSCDGGKFGCMADKRWCRGEHEEDEE